jgi:3-hydroxybutyryl-CoA dehydrogenase
MSIEAIAVVGAGQMGTGIAQVCLTANLAVILNDVSDAALTRARAGIEKGLGILVRKEKLSAEERDRTLSALTLTTRIEDLARADFAVEAAPEQESLKLGIFRALDALLSPERILASNTSSISITRIAAATSRPDRVIGMHFMNPVPLMKLIEVVRGLRTSDETFEATVGLARRLGKEPVPANDSPGFVANRVLMPMINEAVYALMEGVARAEDIDTIMTMGPTTPWDRWLSRISSGSTPAWRSSAFSTTAWAIPSTGPARYCASTWRRATSAGNRAGGSSPTKAREDEAVEFENLIVKERATCRPS